MLPQPLVRNGSFKTTTAITDNNNTQGHTRTIQEDILNKLSRGIILVIIWTCKVTFFSLAKEMKRILGGANGKEPTWQCRRHEMGVRSLSQEDPLEEGMASHSSVLAWRIPWTGEPDMLQSAGSQRVGRDRSDLAHTSTRR